MLKPNAAVWLSSSLVRVFPLDPARRRDSLDLAPAARGERVSFQVCVRPEGAMMQVAVAVTGGPGPVTIRRVGGVPMFHHTQDLHPVNREGTGRIPGYVPDPLFPESAATLPPGETGSFWVTVAVPATAKPGNHLLAVTVSVDKTKHRLAVGLPVSSVVARPRRGLPVTNWFWLDALCDRYGVGLGDDRLWTITGRYMANLVEHGNDTLYTPVFTPPLHSPRRSVQLLGVRRTGTRYTFNWSQVKRWTDLARAGGITRFEWNHLCSQWGAKHAPAIFLSNGRPCWPDRTAATAPAYRRFLSQWLPALQRFLRAEGLDRVSYFHISDEPALKALPQYARCRTMLRETAPWMRIMDALSDLEFARRGLVDTPVVITNHAAAFARAGIPHWVYTCCYPRGAYVNRLFDSPLAAIRLHGALFYRLRAKGYLHWGYNYWYRGLGRDLIDPFTVPDSGNWPLYSAGDPFIVYPGADGPLDSIRWEVLSEGLQDYALLETLGLSPDDPRLSPLKGYADVPRNPDWINRLRRRILTAP